MVPRTRHTKGEQNTSLLLPPRPNRGKANLSSRIRTIEKSPRLRPLLRSCAATAAQINQKPSDVYLLFDEMKTFVSASKENHGH
jgi:hypothetical protein